MAWDAAAFCLPFVPGSYISKITKVAKVKIPSRLCDIYNTGNYLISSYNILKKVTAKKLGYTGTPYDIQRHHLIEKRFYRSFRLKKDDFPSIILTRSLHTIFTNRWKKEIPRYNSEGREKFRKRFGEKAKVDGNIYYSSFYKQDFYEAVDTVYRLSLIHI